MKAALTLAFSVAAVVLPRAQPIPAALVKMADTERAFAQRAADTTVRQAFIDFFADEAVGFEPDPVPAREALRKRTTPQAPGFQLLWEPRLGDVASSGDLGYLTGPAEFVNRGRPNTYGCYFSVWKRQPGGEFRVILDVGIETPEKTPFAPGFVRSSAVASWKRRESRTGAETSLDGSRQTTCRGHRVGRRQGGLWRRDAPGSEDESDRIPADDARRRCEMAGPPRQRHDQRTDES